MVLPAIDVKKAQRTADQVGTRAGYIGTLLVVEDRYRLGFMSIVNRVFAQVRPKWFGYLAEDAYAGCNWLEKAIRALEASPGFSFLGFNDGKWEGAIAGFGLARAEWAHHNYAGTFFYPEYSAHYGDAELTMIAISEGVYTYDPEALLVEVDYEKHTRRVNSNDRDLYRRRAAEGFDHRVSDLAILKAVS